MGRRPGIFAEDCLPSETRIWTKFHATGTMFCDAALLCFAIAARPARMFTNMLLSALLFRQIPHMGILGSLAGDLELSYDGRHWATSGGELRGMCVEGGAWRSGMRARSLQHLAANSFPPGRRERHNLPPQPRSPPLEFLVLQPARLAAASPSKSATWSQPFL